MLKHFIGDTILLTKYNELTKDLSQTYKDGPCVCFAGQHGVGKSFLVTNILKRAIEKSYSGLYVNLQDIVSMIVSPENEDKSIARNELNRVDFLVIDEFDGRHMGSGAGIDLYGRTLEGIFRTRCQNNLPTFFCSNSPNLSEIFQGPLKISFNSLMNYMEVVTPLGKDFRKMEKK